MCDKPLDSGFLREDDPSIPDSDATVSFRQIIPKPDHPRTVGVDQHDAVSWCQSRKGVPAPAWLIDRLEIKNIERPYKGFSADGHPRPMFRYEEDEGAPVAQASAAVDRLLERLSDEEKKEVIKGDVADDDEFRAWSNPELYVNPGEHQHISCADEQVESGLTRPPRRSDNRYMTYSRRLCLPRDTKKRSDACTQTTF